MKTATENKTILSARPPASARPNRSERESGNGSSSNAPVERLGVIGLNEGAVMESTTQTGSVNTTTVEQLPAYDAQQLVHFELTMPKARKVCIAGSFNDWKPEVTELIRLKNGKWAKDLMLSPGVYEYRLVVDGDWMPDPKAAHSVPNPFGEPNSVLTVSPPTSA